MKDLHIKSQCREGPGAEQERGGIFWLPITSPFDNVFLEETEVPSGVVWEASRGLYCHYLRVQDPKDDGFLPGGSPDSINQNNKPQILA